MSDVLTVLLCTAASFAIMSIAHAVLCMARCQHDIMVRASPGVLGHT